MTYAQDTVSFHVSFHNYYKVKIIMKIVIKNHNENYKKNNDLYLLLPQLSSGHLVAKVEGIGFGMVC